MLYKPQVLFHPRLTLEDIEICNNIYTVQRDRRVLNLEPNVVLAKDTNSHDSGLVPVGWSRIQSFRYGIESISGNVSWCCLSTCNKNFCKLDAISQLP